MKSKSIPLEFWSLFACLVALIFLSVSISVSARMNKLQAKDIVETAVTAGNFTTLTKALDVAGLTETLKGPGPYTLFAPTDEAFAKLPEGTMDALLKNPDKLKRVLIAHVLSGKIMAKDISAMKTAKTIGGSSFPVKTADGKVKLAESNVVKADINASNGVIHAIDAVLIPAD